MPDFNPPVNKKVAKELIDFALDNRNLLLKNEFVARQFALKVKDLCEGNAAAGAYLLNFIYDESKIAYHSQVDTWQREFGYNDMYDDVFRVGSFMHNEKFEFNYAGEEYVLWTWKGDYWNLQSGGAIGLYVKNRESSNTKHYDVVDFELPMTLNLYNYYGENNIENVFSWAPDEPQWWITGFNPDFTEPNPNKMVSLGTVDFTGREEMFDDLENAMNFDDNKDIKDYLIFDEDGHTVWVIWYKGVAII